MVEGQSEARVAKAWTLRWEDSEGWNQCDFGFCSRSKGSHEPSGVEGDKANSQFTKLFARIFTGPFPGLRKESTSVPPTCAFSWLVKWSRHHTYV